MTEFLLAVLAAIDRRIVHVEERVNDLFDGAWDVAGHYGSWLEGHKLSEGLTGEPSGDNLTRKGRTNARPFFTSVFARGTQNCDVHHSTPLPTELTGKTEFRAHCELAAPGPEADFLMGCYDA
jgi:hypothetical protein